MKFKSSVSVALAAAAILFLLAGRASCVWIKIEPDSYECRDIKTRMVEELPNKNEYPARIKTATELKVGVEVFEKHHVNFEMLFQAIDRMLNRANSDGRKREVIGPNTLSISTARRWIQVPATRSVLVYETYTECAYKYTDKGEVKVEQRGLGVYFVTTTVNPDAYYSTSPQWRGQTHVPRPETNPAELEAWIERNKMERTPKLKIPEIEFAKPKPGRGIWRG